MSYPYTPVESSNVAGATYDDKSRELQLTFKNGATYQYDGVPPSVGNAFPFMESKGKAVWQILRGKYSYKRI